MHYGSVRYCMHRLISIIAGNKALRAVVLILADLGILAVATSLAYSVRHDVVLFFPVLFTPNFVILALSLELSAWSTGIHKGVLRSGQNLTNRKYFTFLLLQFGLIFLAGKLLVLPYQSLIFDVCTTIFLGFFFLLLRWILLRIYSFSVITRFSLPANNSFYIYFYISRPEDLSFADAVLNVLRVKNAGLVSSTPGLVGRSSNDSRIILNVNQFRDVAAQVPWALNIIEMFEHDSDVFVEKANLPDGKIVVTSISGAIRSQIAGKLAATFLSLSEFRGGVAGRRTRIHHKNHLAGRSILITGAGGTIGSAIINALSKQDVRHLVGIDMSERSLYEVKERVYPRTVDFILCDYGEPDLMREICLKYEIDLVIHAGAYKHVAFAERSPELAINNNYHKLVRMLEVLRDTRVDSFLLISTDKAADPSNIMGLSKRLCEVAVENAAFIRHRAAVRFGNVYGSSGSAVLKFLGQIQRREQIELADEHLERYFMDVNEAVSLCLDTLSLVEEEYSCFVLDMGKPIRIKFLVETLARCLGTHVTEDPEDRDGVQIRYGTLSPEEKLSEVLYGDSEAIIETNLMGIMRLKYRDDVSLRGEVERYLERNESGVSQRAAKVLGGLLDSLH